MTQQYRFSFDLGTSSIGWAVFSVSPSQPDGIIDLLDCGSRIFSNSRILSKTPKYKVGTSLAVPRREARQTRRNMDRFVRRHRTLLRILCENNLFPSDKETQERYKKENPYALRANLLKEKASLYEIGRAILHLNKRRGFKSSRKDASDAEGGQLADGIKKLQEILAKNEHRTLGEFFAHKQGLIGDTANTNRIPQSVLCRKKNPIDKTTEEKDGDYDFYIDRKFVQNELEALWEKQKEFHTDTLTEELYNTIHNAIFHQRSLLPQEVGKCTLDPNEICASRAMPSFQEYTLLLDLNNMRFITPQNEEYPLSLKERNMLFETLSIVKELSFKKIRTLLKLSPEIHIKHSHLKNNDEGKSKLPGCSTNTKLLKALGKERYTALTLQQKDTLAYIILDCTYEEEGIALLTKTIVLPENPQEAVLSDKSIEATLKAFTIFGTKKNPTPILNPKHIDSLPQFSEEEAQKLIDLKLEPYYGRLSLKIINELLPFLKEDVITYSKACELVGYHHSKLSNNKDTEELIDPITGEITKKTHLHSSLKYYGEILPHAVIGEWKEERSGAKWTKLNNRQRYGFITNPSIHVALNQLRIVVNTLIKKHGKPTSIAIELARELPLGPKGKQELHNDMLKNTENNEYIKTRIREHFGAEYYPSSEDILRVKLFDEAEKAFGTAICVYSGKTIAFDPLFTREIEVDHILHFSGSNDDSFANKILCYAHENKNKSGNSPYEHYSANPERWNAIAQRVTKLPKNKAWRFREDSVEEFEKKKSFTDRALNDTRYISRIAKEYLGTICEEKNITAITGSTTSLLAKYWNLRSITEDYNPNASTEKFSGQNKEKRGDLTAEEKEKVDKALTKYAKNKDRSTHLHHAIDACLIGATTRSIVQKIALHAKSVEDYVGKAFREGRFGKLDKQQEFAIKTAFTHFTLTTIDKGVLKELPEEQKKIIREDIIAFQKNIPPPFEDFADKIKAILDKKVISHKVDHNTSGALHAETNYGKLQNSLKIKDFTLEDFALIKDTSLLTTLLQELADAHGIPSTPKEIDALAQNIHGTTALKSSKALIKLFKKSHPKASDEEVFSKFKPIFSRICKKLGIKRIECMDKNNRFLGNVQRRIDVSDFASKDLPYIKDQQLLARLLYKYFNNDSDKKFSYEKALEHAKCLHNTDQKKAKQYVATLFYGIDDKTFTIRFRTICHEMNIRRIKITENKEQLIWIKDKKGVPYRGVDGRNNAYTSIYISPSGAWKGECISAFAHNQKNNRNKNDYTPEWQKNSENIHVIDIYKKDAIEIDVPDGNGERAIYIVQKMGAGNGIELFLHSEANVAARESDLRKEKTYIQSAIGSLPKYNPSFVYIDPLGNVIYKKDIQYSR